MAPSLDRRLEEAREYGPAAFDPAVEKPVAVEELVVVWATTDMGARPSGDGRHEAYPLESGLDSRSRQNRRAADCLAVDSRRVVGEQRYGVGVRPAAEALLESIEEGHDEGILL